MAPAKRRLVTIITEALIESDLIHELQNLGVLGYTITDARGGGHRGIRDAGWEMGASIRVEVVCDAPMAAKISDRMQERFYRDYAMVLFMSDVEVLRPEKF